MNVKQKMLMINVHITIAQYESLKSLSLKTGIPLAHYIREGIDIVLDAANGTNKAKA